MGATTIAKLGPCDPKELGSCSDITLEEFGDTHVIVFRQDEGDSRISTLLLRGATQNALNDLQRAIENCVNSVKTCVPCHAQHSAASVVCFDHLSLWTLY